MPTDDPDRLELDRYLDGLLVGEPLDRFQAQLDRDPLLQEQVERQRQIDLSLRTQFKPPAAVAAPAWTHNGHVTPAAKAAPGTGEPTPVPAGLAFPEARGSKRVFRPMLAAAAAILFLVGGWLIWSSLPSSRPAVRADSLAAYYERETGDFEPFWTCDTNEQFAAAFRNRFGQPLLLHPLPDGVTARGLDYNTIISPQTMTVLMLDGDRKILVLVDRADRDGTGLSAPSNSALRVHRAVVDDLVLYEVSTESQPLMLQHFFNPDRQGAPSTQGRWK